MISRLYMIPCRGLGGAAVGGNVLIRGWNQVMEQQKELEAFGALVYSSNFDYVAQSGDDGVAV